MAVGGIAATSGVALGAERFTNAVEIQNQRQQELKERVDSGPVSTAKSASEAITGGAVRAVSPIAFGSASGNSEQLLSDEDLKLQIVQQEELKAVETQSLVQLMQQETKGKELQEANTFLEKVTKLDDQKLATTVAREENADASNLFLFQQHRDTLDSFSQLTRARDAFAAAARLQTAAVKDEAFVEQQSEFKLVATEAVSFREQQSQLTQEISDNDNLHQSEVREQRLNIYA